MSQRSPYGLQIAQLEALERISGGSTAYTAEVNAPAATTPVALGSGPFIGVVIAKSTNTQNVLLGTATLQVAPLAPGEERDLSTADLASWYLKAGVNGEGVYLVGGV